MALNILHQKHYKTQTQGMNTIGQYSQHYYIKVVWCNEASASAWVSPSWVKIYLSTPSD